MIYNRIEEGEYSPSSNIDIYVEKVIPGTGGSVV